MIETAVEKVLPDHKALSVDELERARTFAKTVGLDPDSPEARRLELEARVREMKKRSAMLERELDAEEDEDA